MIKTHYNYKPPIPRRIEGVSETIPDQTMSLQHLVSKYVRGLPISVGNYNGKFTGEEIAEDFEKMDLAEQEQIQLNAANELSDLKQRIKKARETKAFDSESEIKALKAQIEALSGKDGGQK